MSADFFRQGLGGLDAPRLWRKGTKCDFGRQPERKYHTERAMAPGGFQEMDAQLSNWPLGRSVFNGWIALGVLFATFSWQA